MERSILFSFNQTIFIVFVNVLKKKNENKIIIITDQN